jgi:hypothetical protein
MESCKEFKVIDLGGAVKAKEIAQVLESVKSNEGNYTAY